MRYLAFFVFYSQEPQAEGKVLWLVFVRRLRNVFL